MKKMNKFHRLFLFLWLELRRSIFRKEYTAAFDLTDNCNLRCKHCYFFYNKENIKEELPIGVWEKRFYELYKSGIRSVLLVGGEPAIRKDILMLADKIFPDIHLITNGTIRIPKEFNHTLFVSVDGSSKTNDSIRGNNVFSKVIENYSGDKRVIINMTIMKDNYKELEDVVKISKANGFTGVVCNIFTPAIDYRGPMFITKEERKDIINELKRVNALYPDDFLMTKAMIKWYENPDHTKECNWRDDVLHFDVSWNRRKCFTNDIDCSNCGCLSGAMQSPLMRLKSPIEATKLMLKYSATMD